MQSRTYGTLCSVTVSGVSIAAARQGSAEFFAPLTVTRPLKGAAAGDSEFVHKFVRVLGQRILPIRRA